MRSSVKALWDRLGDIVQLGKRRGVPVICNGDGEGWANWTAIREKTGESARGVLYMIKTHLCLPAGASSVMIARAAESNPSIFHPSGPISTMESLIPTHFLPLCAYINNHYSNTKFLLYQFKPSPAPISSLGKAERKRFSDGIAAAKTIDQAVQFFGSTMPLARDQGAQFLKDLKQTLKERQPGAYGADEHGDDWARAAFAAVPTTSTVVEEGKMVPAHVDTSTTDIFQERKRAEVEGKVVDAPVVEEGTGNAVLTQEELDEEAMMNA